MINGNDDLSFSVNLIVFLMKSAEAEEGDCDVTRNNNHFADFFTAQKSLGCLNYAACQYKCITPNNIFIQFS